MEQELEGVNRTNVTNITEGLFSHSMFTLDYYRVLNKDYRDVSRVQRNKKGCSGPLGKQEWGAIQRLKKRRGNRE